MPTSRFEAIGRLIAVAGSTLDVLDAVADMLSAPRTTEPFDFDPAWLARWLNLTRPLVFLDVESTQPHEQARPNPENDQIVQFGALKILPDGTTREFETLVKPLIPVTAASTEVHGITQAMVDAAESWRDVGPGIVRALDGCDIAGYNVKRYDVAIIRAECRRHRVAEPDAGFLVVDPYRVAAEYERRDLAWAHRFYCGTELTGAHGALADAVGSARVLAGQITRYPDLPARSVSDLSSFCFPVDPSWIDSEGKFQWRDGQAVVAFGKNDGVPIQAVDAGFWQWMQRGNFEPDAKKIARDALRGVYPEPKVTS